MKKIITTITLLAQLNLYASSQIIGGKIPEESSLIAKSTVALVGDFYNDGKLHTFCSGTVIGKKIVITAAHCLFHAHLKEIFVTSGTDASSGKKIKVNQFKYIPDGKFDYLSDNFDISFNDIAILVTNEDLDLTPVSIGEPTTIDKSKEFILAGYGLKNTWDKIAENPELNVTGILHTVSNFNFFELNKARLSMIEGDEMITMKGDSGGPLFEFNNDSLILHGVLSNGGTKEILNNMGIPTKVELGNYTHPYYFQNWINCSLKESERQINSRFSNQFKCDDQPLLDISELKNFNRIQCETQMPGYTIKENSKGECMPITLEACKILATKVNMNYKWDQNDLNCELIYEAMP
jgi:secreted trypsin-like serine protease